MALSTPAEIEAFLALSGPVSITYLDDLGMRCDGHQARMVRLQRPAPRSDGAGQGLLTIRFDAADAEPIFERIFASAAPESSR